MRAVVLHTVPAALDALVVREHPVPRPEPGWVLIEVKAFGVNRSELKTRLGLADPDVTLPRVPESRRPASSRPARAASWPSAGRSSR